MPTDLELVTQILFLKVKIKYLHAEDLEHFSLVLIQNSAFKMNLKWMPTLNFQEDRLLICLGVKLEKYSIMQQATLAVG